MATTGLESKLTSRHSMNQSPSISHTSSILFSKLATALLVVADGRAQSQYFEARLQDSDERKLSILIAAEVLHGFCTQ
jgi:hypothetical protein